MARSGRSPTRDPLDRFRVSPERVEQARQFAEHLSNGGDREPPIVDRQQGFNMTPLNEPVSPTDCRRWPNSPFCEGSVPAIAPGADALINTLPRPLRDPVNRLVPLVPFVGINPLADWGVNNCEAWVCATGNLAYWETPPVCVAYRWGDGNCVPNPTEQEPQPDPEPLPPGSSRFMPNQSREGWIPGCRYFLYVELLSNERPDGGSIDGSSLNFGNPALLFPELDMWTAPVGGRDFKGWILPCYGPITGIQIETYFYGTWAGWRPAWMFSVLCGGMGMFPYLAIPQSGLRLLTYVEGVDFKSRNWVSDVTRFESTYRQFQGWDVPRRREPPYAIWHQRYGEYPIYVPFGSTVASLPGQIHSFPIEANIGNFPGLKLTIVPAASIPPWNNRIPWGTSCAAPPVPPPSPTYPSNNDMGCSCRDIEAMIDRKLLALLGFNERRRMTVNVEQLIKQYGNTIYAGQGNNSVSVGNVPQLISAIMAAHFFRSGLHRLPATLPNLSGEDDRDVSIHDMVSLWDWYIKEMDGIWGSWPFKVSITADDGTQNEVKIDSMADFAAELMGALVPIADDANLAHHYASRALAEAAKAESAAIVAQDYAKANAQYMGYKGSTVARVIDLSFSPFLDPPEEEGNGGGNPQPPTPPAGVGSGGGGLPPNTAIAPNPSNRSIAYRLSQMGGFDWKDFEFFMMAGTPGGGTPGGGTPGGGTPTPPGSPTTPGGGNNPQQRTERDGLRSSRQSIPGWQWDGDDNLQDALNQIKVMCGIIKGALVQMYERGGRVTGDFMRGDADGDGVRDSTEWEQFLTQRRTPPENLQNPNDPTIAIRDVSPAARPRPRTVPQPPRRSGVQPSPSPTPRPSPGQSPTPNPSPSPNPPPP